MSIRPGLLIDLNLFSDRSPFDVHVTLRVVYLLQERKGKMAIGGSFLRELSAKELHDLVG